MQEIIEAAWETRSLLKETKTQETIREVIDLLDNCLLYTSDAADE